MPLAPLHAPACSLVTTTNPAISRLALVAGTTHAFRLPDAPVPTTHIAA